MKGDASVAANVVLGERLLLLPGVQTALLRRTLWGFVCSPTEKAGSDGSFP